LRETIEKAIPPEDHEMSEQGGKPEFVVGQQVRITTGVFKDFPAVVETLDLSQRELVVRVTVHGRTTPVGLSFDDVATGPPGG
jgi:transcription antitermination factor NusG